MLESLRETLSRVRKLIHLVQTPRFLTLYDSASSERRKEVEKLVQEIKVEEVESWMYYESFSSLNTMSVAELRKVAATYRVMDYNFMRKDELIEVITDERRKIRDHVPNQIRDLGEGDDFCFTYTT